MRKRAMTQVRLSFSLTHWNWATTTAVSTITRICFRCHVTVKSDDTEIVSQQHGWSLMFDTAICNHHDKISKWFPFRRYFYWVFKFLFNENCFSQTARALKLCSLSPYKLETFELLCKTQQQKHIFCLFISFEIYMYKITACKLYKLPIECQRSWSWHDRIAVCLKSDIDCTVYGWLCLKEINLQRHDCFKDEQKVGKIRLSKKFARRKNWEGMRSLKEECQRNPSPFFLIRERVIKSSRNKNK